MPIPQYISGIPELLTESYDPVKNFGISSSRLNLTPSNHFVSENVVLPSLREYHVVRMISAAIATAKSEKNPKRTALLMK